MKVFVPKTSNVAKILGLSLVSLVFSLSLSAFDQNQAEQGKTRKVSKGADQSQAQTKDCGQGQSQSQTQSKDCGQGQSQAQSDQSQVSKGKISDCGTQAPAPATCATAVCGASIAAAGCSHHDSRLRMGPKSSISSWYAKDYQLGEAGIWQNWSGACWKDSRFENMGLYHVTSKGMSLNNVWVQGQFRHWDLDSSDIQNTTFSGLFEDVDYKDATLTNVLFQDAKFQRKHFRRSNFDGATLRNVQFVRSSLSGMTFKKTHLDSVTFECSQIKDADIFEGAYLWNGHKWIKVKGDLKDHIQNQLKHCRSQNVNSASWLQGFKH